MIKEFRNEYAFCSNFYYANQTASTPIGPVTFPTNEHFFVCMKTLKTEEFIAILNAPTPGIAKRMGGPRGYHMPNGEIFRISLRDNWSDLRIGVMATGLRLKFTQNVDLRKVLIASAPHILQEGNWWHDKFWGVDNRTGEGENMLGKLLMDLRENLILMEMEVKHKLTI